MEQIFSNDFHYLGLIVLFPLLGAIINGVFGSKLPKSVVDIIASGAVLLSFFFSILSVNILVQSPDSVLTYTAYQWIYTGSLSLDIAFMLDPLSAMMILIITGVGFLIHLYSTSYMAEDPAKWKYFSYLNLFVFAMLLLVLGKNLLVTFIGWEGVGACSYLLIGFWYTDDEKAAAGQKAFIVNRIGDFAFIVGILLLYSETGTFDYIQIHEMVTGSAAIAIAPVAAPAVILIFIGCTGKSAQFPLYTWLPDAMAGPTPVSALIHAATMVTSGIFLLSRLNGLVSMSHEAMWIIAIVGAITAFFAATMALVNNDIKGVLAYSTVSQLGYMFIGIGVGSFVGAVFHLMTHAFFKACLFLGSGSVIHAMGGEQDIRKMGGLKKWMPVTRMTFLVACVAIAGIPIIGAGFFSKDLILWGALSNVHAAQIEPVAAGGIQVQYLISQALPAITSGSALEIATMAEVISWVVYLLGVVTAFMTAFYMFRLYFLTFEGECRADEETQAHLHESPPAILIALIVLAVLSFIGGWTGWPHVWAPEGAAHYMLAFEHWFDPVFQTTQDYRIANRFGDGYAAWEWGSIIVGSTMAFSGVGLAYLFYRKRPGLPRAVSERLAKVHTALLNKWWVDEIYDFLFVKRAIQAGKASYDFDRFFLDGLLVNGAGFVTASLGKAMRHLQSGDVQRYATYIVLAIVLALMALL